jgi:hypothetical protein
MQMPDQCTTRKVNELFIRIIKNYRYMYSRMVYSQSNTLSCHHR